MVCAPIVLGDCKPNAPEAIVVFFRHKNIRTKDFDARQANDMHGVNISVTFLLLDMILEIHFQLKIV